MNAVEKKRVLILGGSGFIGESLGEALVQNHYQVEVLSRRPKELHGTLAFPAKIGFWDGQTLDPSQVEGLYGVINLSGESIAEGRWSEAKKKRLLNSRVESTSALVRAIDACAQKPEVLIQGSAVGFYGDQDLESKDESAPMGQGFLASLCQQWEGALTDVHQQLRTIVMRTGVVLGWGGGALQELNGIYATGAGAGLGHGKQWMNWIHIDDIVNFVVRALDDSSFKGTYNLVAPDNVTNQNFHRAMANFFKLSSPINVPSILLWGILGEKAGMLLSGPKVMPKRLQEHGFSFQWTSFDAAMTDLFGQRKYPAAFVLSAKQYVPQSPQEAWPFFATETNLERLTPSFLNFKVRGKSTPELQEDSIITYTLKLHGLPMQWKSRIEDWQPGHCFVDTQIKGPYKIWYHQHFFKPLGTGTQLIDFVQFQLPLYPFSLAALAMVKNDVQKIFAYRRQAIKEIFGDDTLK